MLSTAALGERRHRPCRGMALLVCLGLIALLTILVLSYLLFMQQDRLSTQNYSQSVRAQELAQGALQEILEDLRIEMEAGSLASPEYNVNGVRVYIPATTRSMLPARIGFDAADYTTDVDAEKLPPSLIRVSRASGPTSDPFFEDADPQDYPGTLPSNWASPVSSTQRSANGRRMTAARWNKPFLLGAAVPEAFSDTPPDWVYVTREGRRVFRNEDVEQMKADRDLSRTEAVLGRYAFVMYEQGGLLDVNAAGYPTSLPSPANPPSAEEIRGKSALAYADLMQLPGMSGKQGQLDAFLNWRSKGALASAAYGNGSFSLMVKKLMPEGFLRFQTGDSPILGRQDLIDYFQKKMGTAQPLAYLGTFSRSLDAPSWRPEKPAGSTVDYAADAEKPASANRNLANVRFKSEGTITHYRDDATSADYTVKEGDPLLQSRFSLARLAWLEQANPDTGSGPSSEYAQAIKACFGLVWDYPGGNGGATAANGGNRCWNYIGTAGSIGNPPGKIKTLDEVADEGREPDFFELLKAAVLSGSVGKTPGLAAFDNGRQTWWAGNDYNYKDLSDTLKRGPVGFYAHSIARNGNFPAPARVPDMQIIRIGANIIDQSDEDSYPTAIWFNYFKNTEFGGDDRYDQATRMTPANPIHGPMTIAFGTENLPYITKMVQLNATPERGIDWNKTPAPGLDQDVDTMGGWRQPELWNPHQAPNTSPSGETPARFQIRAYGSAQTFWSRQGSNFHPVYGHQSGRSEPQDWHLSNAKLPADISAWSNDEKVGTLEFTIASGTSAFSDKPYPLMTDGIPGVTATSPHPGNLANEKMPHYGKVMTNTGLPNHFAAFSTGVTSPVDLGTPYRPFWVQPHTTTGTLGANQGVLTPGTYVLGWLDGSGGFHPYSFFTGVFAFAYSTLEAPSNQVGSASANDMSPCRWYLADPRTERFSLAFNFFSSAVSSSLTATPANGTNTTSWAAPMGDGFVSTAATARFLPGSYMANSPNHEWLNTSYYNDPDGVTRPGDGVFGARTTGDGLMLFTSNAAPTGGSLYAAGDSGGNIRHGRRPVILNRPFRSVGELGYVFRDQPFKTLDFFTKSSADAALLEVFSLADTANAANGKLVSVTAGGINPNTAPSPVLQAVLAGGAKKEADLAYNLTPAQAESIAENLMNLLKDSPARNRADLALTLASDSAAGTGPVRDVLTNSPDRGNKAYLEAPMRALSDIGNMRTWNLLIDVVAQSGKMSPKAAGLDDFLVEGERRYWLHVAIDRHSGKVIDQQLEPVYE